MKAAFIKHNIAFQRFTPHIHRRNSAERAIQSWKIHFISGLSSTDPDFPISKWDHLTKKCDITLNLIRSYLSKPKLSAYTFLFGNFEFNQTPLAVPGTKVFIHETPKQWLTISPHVLYGYYIGPSLD